MGESPGGEVLSKRGGKDSQQIIKKRKRGAINHVHLRNRPPRPRACLRKKKGKESDLRGTPVLPLCRKGKARERHYEGEKKLQANRLSCQLHQRKERKKEDQSIYIPLLKGREGGGLSCKDLDPQSLKRDGRRCNDRRKGNARRANLSVFFAKLAASLDNLEKKKEKGNLNRKLSYFQRKKGPSTFSAGREKKKVILVDGLLDICQDHARKKREECRSTIAGWYIAVGGGEKGKGERKKTVALSFFRREGHCSFSRKEKKRKRRGKKISIRQALIHR